MRRILIPSMLLLTAFAGSSVMADDSTSNDMNGNATVRSEKDMSGGYLKNEVVGIKPQVGIMSFQDLSGSNTSRAAAGFTLDMNATPLVMGPDSRSLFIGPSTGFIYSHVGSSGSNFFGTNSDVAGTGGANAFQIPLNLKLGWNVSEAFRVAAHGGGNLLYRSIASSLALGSSSLNSGSDWTIFPNVGADVEFGIGRNTALILRPDFTITPGNDIFTGTIGFTASLG